MCLDLKWWSKKRIATKDIVVYKVVETVGWGSEALQSPYRSMPVNIGETYSIPEPAIGKLGSKVYQGFHSLKGKKYAKKLTLGHYRGRVAKCIIPKGSTYYNGTWNRFQLFNPIGYVSDSIKYVEILTIKQ